MIMPAVFTIFAIIFLVAGWLLPHTVHRLGFRMAAFYLCLAFVTSVYGALRSPKRD